MSNDLRKEWELAKADHKSKLEIVKITSTPAALHELNEARKTMTQAENAYKDAVKQQRKIEQKANLDIREEEKEEKSELQNYQEFCNARDIHKQYNFGLLRRTGEFFIQKTFIDLDKKDPEISRCITEIETYGYELIGKSFIELSDRTARNYLRKMMEGGKINIKNADGEWEEWTGSRRVYHKLVNTIHINDPDTFNIIDLSKTIKPKEENHECPWILKCLFKALGRGIEENIEWIEKWVYSVAVADIGNNQTPAPVIYGAGKVGKNSLTEIVISGILGKESVFTGTWDLIGESNFNQFKLGKVAMFIDEIPERSEWTKVKNWTGSLQDYVKVKYGPEYTIDNVIALAFGSNEKVFPLPWEDGEQMQRVSPLKVGPTTFAEYVVKDIRNLYPDTPNMIEDLVKSKIGYVPDTEHLLGDKFLRNFNSLWASKEILQDLVNYLHTKYNPGNDKVFVLSPLRGSDWSDLCEEKKDYVRRAIDWVIKKPYDYVVIDDLYEVYEYMNKSAKRDNYKRKQSFGMAAAEYFKTLNWTPKDMCSVEYKLSMVNVNVNLANGGPIARTGVERKKVYFRDDFYQSKVKSLIDEYFSEVKDTIGIKRILKDD